MSASSSHVPLFAGPAPEGAVALERSIVAARLVGIALVLIGVASGQVRAPLGVTLALLAALAGTSAFVALGLRAQAEATALRRIVISAGDIAIIALAQLLSIGRDPWTAPAASLLAVIVIAFRFGRGGALVSAATLAMIFIAEAAYRQTVAGLETTIETAGSWTTLYFICALIMSFMVRELALLREHQRVQRERDVALLDAQSDLGEMLFVTDGERILETNGALPRVVGRPLAPAMHLSEIFDPPDVARIAARSRVDNNDRFEVGLRASDGRRELEMAVKSVRQDGGRVIAVARDITERKRIELSLQEQSLRDPLTGLAARPLLRDRIERAITGVPGALPAVTVVMLDIARFRHLNDTLGFHAGDQLIRAVGQRLRECVLPSDTVARLSGDEFAVALEGAGHRRSERATAAIVRALERPFELEGSTIEVNVCFGIARFPEHGTDADTLLQHAEYAMYEAKLAGSRIATYAPTHGATAPSQLVVAEIRGALERDEIHLFYQPQVRLSDGVCVGVEALARWQHARLGMVMPADFVPVIEGTTVWRSFSDRVLLTAIADRAVWPADHRQMRLAVNLSGRDLFDPVLPAAVKAFLAGNERSLVVEVTERGLGSDPAPIRDTLNALCAQGVTFSIDDFGTGASSLSHLIQLPVSEVKIDRSFVSGMCGDPRRSAIVRGTIQLAHALGSTVVAEGVEDEATWDLLATMGCDSAQGFFIAAPTPPEQIVAWLTDRARAGAATLN
jgi:diguanylate cyclase (GGDEF)-like protein